MSQRFPGRRKATRADPPAAASDRRRPARRSSPALSPLRALVDDSGEGMILADAEGRILFANNATEDLLGYGPAELEGRIGFELCEPESLPTAHAGFDRCLALPGTPVEFTVAVTHPDGRSRLLDIKLVNRLDRPEVAAVVVHFHEAPARTGTREPGPGVEEYRALFYSAPIGLGVAELDGTLLTFNDAILQPGGYTREDIQRLGNVSKLYCNPADQNRVLALARSQGFVWREEVPFRRKDGTGYDTLLTLTPVRIGGRPCWFATVEDVTERKQAEADRQLLEAELRQAQKMEAVGNMAAGIAHDFNNVLSVIMLNADLLAEGVKEQQDPLLQHVASLQQAVQLGAAMIRKILGFSRQTVLNPARADLAVVAENLRTMVGQLLPASVHLEIRGEPGAVAHVDVSAVEQMLLNLVTNARDAMPGGGSLVIDVRNVVRSKEDIPEWMRPGAYARVAVTDTGTGMDEAVRARAIRPFFTTKQAGAGTGLGLAMVYGLIKQHDGFVELESEVGKGTTVSLYFPPARPGGIQSAERAVPAHRRPN